MIIELVSVNVEDKGKYRMATVAYRSDGKLAEKKLMSFGAAADVFKIITAAKQGDSFNIKAQKNDKGYWDWVEATQGDQAGTTAGGSKVANATPRSTYETPEERAARQVLIVRQSSITNAVEYMKLNPKKTPTTAEVLEVAKQFENFVFGKKDEPDAAGGIAEMSDDVPY